MQRNENLWKLPVGVQNGAATLENGLAVFRMIENSYHMTQQFRSWLYTQEKWKHVHTQMFIAALVIKAKGQKQPNVSTDEKMY